MKYFRLHGHDSSLARFVACFQCIVVFLLAVLSRQRTDAAVGDEQTLPRLTTVPSCPPGSNENLQGPFDDLESRTVRADLAFVGQPIAVIPLDADDDDDDDETLIHVIRFDVAEVLKGSIEGGGQQEATKRRRRRLRVDVRVAEIRYVLPVV